MTMTLGRILSTLGIAVLLSSVSSHAAQSTQSESGAPTNVPRFIILNGSLSDQNGKPLSGVVGLTFAVYRDQDGGAPLWLESQNAQLDEQGRYNVLLGTFSKGGLPVDLFTSSESRWLGVQPMLSGEKERSRSLLVSVPYALKAGDADTLGGKPASAYKLSADAGSNGASGSELSDNTGNAPFVSQLNSGNPGYIGMFTNTTDLVNSAMFQNGTGIGIGTTTPAASLDVNGTLYARAGAVPVGNYGVQVLGAAGSVDRDIFALSAAGLSNGFTVQRVSNSMKYVFNDGAVGIGTNSPGAALDVNGNLLALAGPVPAGNYGVQVRGAPGSIDRDIFLVAAMGLSNGFTVQRVSDQMRYTFSDGRVGIGTSNPTAPLDVVGAAKATSFAGDGSALTNVNASLLGGLAASAFGDITSVAAGAGLTGGATTGAATLAMSAAALTRGITYLGGCDTCSVLGDTDDQKTIYLNVVGPMTVQSVTCFSDAGTPTINIQRDDGSPANVLSSDLACSTSGATTTSFSGAESLLGSNEKLDFVMVNAGGVAKRVTVSIKTVLN
jgi:hypothetical protein